MERKQPCPFPAGEGLVSSNTVIVDGKNATFMFVIDRFGDKNPEKPCMATKLLENAKREPFTPCLQCSRFVELRMPPYK